MIEWNIYEKRSSLVRDHLGSLTFHQSIIYYKIIANSLIS